MKTAFDFARSIREALDALPDQTTRTEEQGTGNAVDFIQYPHGKGPNDVAAVLPHEGRNAQPVAAPDWYWCLYSGEPFQPNSCSSRVSGGLGSITETLTVENHVILYYMHWRIFKRRLENLIRDGAARQMPAPVGGRWANL